VTVPTPPPFTDTDNADIAGHLNTLRTWVESLAARGDLGQAWPTVDDCVARLGVAPATPADLAALGHSLDATVAMVRRERPELTEAGPIGADTWQGVVILACLDYRAANTPSGFAGYDGGYAGTTDERFRGYQLCRIARYSPPRVG
jgi:hypothetical protein